jgi:hypothetical protein
MGMMSAAHTLTIHHSLLPVSQRSGWLMVFLCSLMVWFLLCQFLLKAPASGLPVAFSTERLIATSGGSELGKWSLFCLLGPCVPSPILDRALRCWLRRQDPLLRKVSLCDLEPVTLSLS